MRRALLVLLAAIGVQAVACADPPAKLLDLLCKVEADRAVVAEHRQAIEAGRAQLAADMRALSEAMAVMEADRAAFRKAWAEIYGGDLEPQPQPTPPEPTPPPNPTPPPEPTKHPAGLAFVLANPDDRTPEQAKVLVWMANHLRKPDGESQFLWYDPRDPNLSTEAKRYLHAPEPPKLVIFGHEIGAPLKEGWHANRQVPLPDSIEEVQRLWKEEGGAL